MTEDEFKKIINLLQRHSEEEITLTFNALLKKAEEMLAQKNLLNERLKKMCVFQGRNKHKFEVRLNELRDVELPEENARFSVYTDTFIDNLKVQSLENIKLLKEQESRIERSLEENRMHLKRQAKILMEVDRLLNQVRQEIKILDMSNRVRNFLLARNVNVITLIEEDVVRFYRQYKREEGF